MLGKKSKAEARGRGQRIRHKINHENGAGRVRNEGVNLLSLPIDSQLENYQNEPWAFVEVGFEKLEKGGWGFKREIGITGNRGKNWDLMEPTLRLSELLVKLMLERQRC